jgi:ABC-type phosphate transport system substrate-binding protein
MRGHATTGPIMARGEVGSALAMIRTALAILAALAFLTFAACGSDDSEGSSGSTQKAAKLSAQESSQVEEAAKAIKSDCGSGKKTPEVTEGAENLVRIYQAKGPDAALASGSSTGAKNLDQVMAAAQAQLQKCGAQDQSAKVVGARATKGRF